MTIFLKSTLSLHFVKLSQKREKDGEQHLKEDEMRRREKLRQQEAKVSVTCKNMYNVYDKSASDEQSVCA